MTYIRARWGVFRGWSVLRLLRSLPTGNIISILDMRYYICIAQTIARHDARLRCFINLFRQVRFRNFLGVPWRTKSPLQMNRFKLFLRRLDGKIIFDLRSLKTFSSFSPCRVWHIQTVMLKKLFQLLLLSCYACGHVWLSLLFRATFPYSRDNDACGSQRPFAVR